jgi:hypothetical protein
MRDDDRTLKEKSPRRGDRPACGAPEEGLLARLTRISCSAGTAQRYRRSRAREGTRPPLAIHEGKRAETAQRFPETALDEEETSRDDLGLAFGAASPAAMGLGIEELAFGEQSRQSGGSAKQVS